MWDDAEWQWDGSMAICQTGVSVHDIAQYNIVS